MSPFLARLCSSVYLVEVQFPALTQKGFPAPGNDGKILLDIYICN